jgi:phosphosulfolactate phosphohydrolase-like enzyme
MLTTALSIVVTTLAVCTSVVIVVATVQTVKEKIWKKG